MNNTLKDYRNQLLDAAKQKDFKRIVHLSEVMIAEGIYDTCVTAGKAYEGGHGVEQDLDKARKLYEMAVEKLQSIEGMLCLARLYYHGLGVKPNIKTAFEYYKKAAEESDHEFANYMLGRMYFFGQYVDVDYDKARQYFLRGFEKGHIYSLTFLGLIEQKQGHFFKGWKLRLKATWAAFRVLRKNSIDRRLRR